MNEPPRRVLVVEDQAAQRAMYEKAVARLGFDVRAVADPASARNELNGLDYALALLDLNLAGESGMDLFEEIRERRPDISVIIVTGFGDYDTARRAIHMDVVEFLTKPVELDALEAAIDKAWRRSVLVRTPIETLDADHTSRESRRPFEELPSLNIEDVERELVLEALRRTNDNRAAAARLLGVSERKLYYQLSRFKTG